MLKNFFNRVFVGTKVESNKEPEQQRNSQSINAESSIQNERIRLPEDSEVRKVWLKVIRGESSMKQLEETLQKHENNTNAVDLHFAYLSLHEHYYKFKVDSSANIEKFLLYAHKDVELYPKFKEEYLNNHQHQVLPFIPSFKQLAIYYEKEGSFQKAIAISEKAMDYGLDDQTKGGYAARILKLKKKSQ